MLRIAKRHHTRNRWCAIRAGNRFKRLFRELSVRQSGALGKGRNYKKDPILSGGAGEKACFRDGASNKMQGLPDKVKRRQTMGNFQAFPVSNQNKAGRSRGNEGQ